MSPHSGYEDITNFLNLKQLKDSKKTILYNLFIRIS